MQLGPQIYGFISIAVGLCTGIYSLYELTRQHASKRWRTTIGEIVESKIEQTYDGWAPCARYIYTVAGKHYENDRIYLHPSDDSDERGARRRLSPYYVGKKVTIYYSPGKPQDAVLDTRVSLWRTLLFLFIALFFVVAGVAIWLDPSILDD